MTRHEVTEGWGQFLSRYEWDWFVTLTFKEQISTFGAHRRVRWFLKDLDRAAGVPIFWFRADEYGERLGRFHIHLLIGNVAHLRRLDWVDEWNRRAGYARIFPFDNTKRAAFYCAKYVTKQSGDWELSENLRAFREYQPALPLSGPTKEARSRESLASENSETPKRRNLLEGPQVRFSFVQGRQDSKIEASVMDVYMSEVTKGRGRFRRFF